MTYGYDDVTFTSTGASATDEVQLNSGTSLSAPDPAHAFNAVVPYQMELGAFTVDESLLTAFRIGLGALLYGVVPVKMLPHKSKAKTLGKSLLTAGIIGGLFDAPSNPSSNLIKSRSAPAMSTPEVSYT